MSKIIIADATLRRKAEIASEHGGSAYSFKAVIETAKLLDRAGVDIIEMGPVTNKKTDGLILKTTAAAVSAKLAVVGGMTAEQIDLTWDTLKYAKSARMIIALPVSAVQMEYLCHKKPAAMLENITTLVSHAASLCDDVEFAAMDATRGDREFICNAVNAAVSAGASSVTLCDTAGIAMPWEFAELITYVRENVPENVAIGVECSDNFGVASASAFEAVRAGCAYIKTGISGTGLPSLLSVCSAISQKSDYMNAETNANMTVLRRTCS
ncbi:MAG: hypothetical protein J6L96_10120, partial [Clostridia bacterium]|nr:hypothetical protein [Clostridia bacterium]